MSNGAVVDLLSEAQATEEEAHSQNEEQIGKNGAQQGCLDDTDLILDQGNDEDDEFHGIAKRHVKQSAKCVAHLTGHGFSRKAKETSERNHGNAVHGEDDAAINAIDVCENDAQGHEYEQDIEPAVGKDEPEGSTKFLGKGALLLAIFILVSVLRTGGCFGGRGAFVGLLSP